MPITDPRIAGGVALGGVVLELIALFVNNISGYSVGDDASYECRWSSVSVCSAGNCISVDWSTSCDLWTQSLATDWEGDVCGTQIAGQVWLAFLIIALLSSVAGAALIIVRTPTNLKSYRNVAGLFLFSFMLCVMALGEWFIINSTNNVCYNTDVDGTYFGGSAFLVIFAAVVYVAAFILSYMARPQQDEQANYSAMTN